MDKTLRDIQLMREMSSHATDHERFKKMSDSPFGKTTRDVVLEEVMIGSNREFHLWVEESFAKGETAENGFKTFIKEMFKNYSDTKIEQFLETKEEDNDYDPEKSELPLHVDRGFPVGDKRFWAIDTEGLGKYAFKLVEVAGKSVVKDGDILMFNPKSLTNDFKIIKASSKDAKSLVVSDLPKHFPQLKPWLSATDLIHQIVCDEIVNNVSEGEPLIHTVNKIFERLSSMFNVFGYEDEEQQPLEEVIATLSSITDLVLNTSRNEEIFIRSSEEKEATKYSYTDKFLKSMKITKDLMKDKYSTYDPCVCEPNPHTDLTSREGGYILKQSSLEKRSTRVMEEELNSWADVIETYQIQSGTFVGAVNPEIEKSEPPKVIDRIDLGQKNKTYVHPLVAYIKEATQPELFKSINKLQNTKFKVNRAVLDRFPLIMEKLEELLGVKMETRRSGFYRTIQVAEEYVDFEYITFPLFFDKRGRIYPYAVNTVSFQGDDLGKALTGFANGRVLTDEGVHSIKLALGEYITSLDEKGNKIKLAKKVDEKKLKIVEKELPRYLEAVANDDYSFVVTEKIKKPFVFIGLLLDLIGYNNDPENYLSHSIVHSDSCASGMQILGLATNCKETLRMTNVLNPTGDYIADVYVEIMKDALELVKKIADGAPTTNAEKPRSLPRTLISEFESKAAYNEFMSDTERKVCKILLNHPELFEDRDIIKTAAMTYINYASKSVSCFEHILVNLYDNHEELFFKLIANNKYADKVSTIDDVFVKDLEEMLDNSEEIEKEEINEFKDSHEIVEESDDSSPSKGKKKVEVVDQDDDLRVINARFYELRAFCFVFWKVLVEKNPSITDAKEWISRLIKHCCEQRNSFGFINPMTGFPLAVRKNHSPEGYLKVLKGELKKHVSQFKNESFGLISNYLKDQSRDLRKIVSPMDTSNYEEVLQSLGYGSFDAFYERFKTSYEAEEEIKINSTRKYANYPNVSEKIKQELKVVLIKKILKSRSSLKRDNGLAMLKNENPKLNVESVAHSFYKVAEALKFTEYLKDEFLVKEEAVKKVIVDRGLTEADLKFVRENSTNQIRFYRTEFSKLSSATKRKATTITRRKPIGLCNVRKTVTSALPGAVHGADAGIILELSKPFEDFAAIHDSAGVHANDVSALRKHVGVVLKIFKDIDFYGKIAEQLNFDEPFPQAAIPYSEEVDGKIEDTTYAFC